jgi:alcohol dehydrogenase (NADP+)
VALGAHEVVLSTDADAMAAQANRFDFLLDTISTSYPMTPYVQALKLDGTLCSLGLPDGFDVSPFALALGRRSIAGSGGGGTRETTEMLDFCAEHGITADVEIVGPADINTALARLAANDVKYRFVIDHART